MLHEVFAKFDQVITVEDGCLQGGMGSSVLEFMVDQGYQAKIKRLGIPDQYIEHGTQPELYHICNYDAKAIEKTASEMIDKVRKEKTSVNAG